LIVRKRVVRRIKQKQNSTLFIGMGMLLGLHFAMVSADTKPLEILPWKKI